MDEPSYERETEYHPVASDQLSHIKVIYPFAPALQGRGAMGAAAAGVADEGERRLPTSWQGHRKDRANGQTHHGGHMSELSSGTMSRQGAIARAERYFDSGAFKAELARRVAIASESQNPERVPELVRYIEAEMKPALEALGFSCRILAHPSAKGPFLLAERIEDPARPTVLGYGHGDVIRGFEGSWKPGIAPWLLVESEGRYWGRGTADNKGQHTVNLAALGAVLEERGRLGFNAKWLIEMGEEIGSAGLRELCAENREAFRADVLIASDGPRLSEERPTIYLGSRGAYPIDLWIDAREGGHHSGNWGNLLSNPAVQLVHALSTIVGPTGHIKVREFVPDPIPASVKRALADCEVSAGPGEPAIDPGWGEPGLTLAEKVFAWCGFEILAMSAGNPDNPVNAIPPRAWARAQIRFVVGVDPAEFLPALRRHLDRHGFPMVEIAKGRDEVFRATRLDPEHPWAQWAAASMTATTGRRPAVLPSTGGALPNDVFAEVLEMPTVWVPHSYRGCSQHAPNEHLPTALAREALALMAGIYWDLGEPGTPGRG
jgi:acetylornithine deacetylase/succinyl-diaminopimelate desuccinylase-like protein